MDPDAEREARRAHRRATMQVRKTTLQDRSGENGLWGPTTPEQRVAMVGTITRSAWDLAGRPWPAYTRRTMPVRVFFRRRAASEDG
jgi:hypothetical protein